MESRGARKKIYPLKDEVEEVGKKKDCGGLSMAEHQVPTKPLFFSFLSWVGEIKFAERYFCFALVLCFMWQGFLLEGLQHQCSLGEELPGSSPEEELGVLRAQGSPSKAGQWVMKGTLPCPLLW